jgi:hypothetical protein
MFRRFVTCGGAALDVSCVVGCIFFVEDANAAVVHFVPGAKRKVINKQYANNKLLACLQTKRHLKRLR